MHPSRLDINQQGVSVVVRLVRGVLYLLQLVTKETAVRAHNLEGWCGILMAT
jgi:hypothetical protein